MDKHKALKLFKEIKNIIKFRPGIQSEIELITTNEAIKNVTFKYLDMVDDNIILTIEITKDKVESPYFNCVYHITYNGEFNSIKVSMYDRGSNLIVDMSRDKEIKTLEDIKNYIPYL